MTKHAKHARKHDGSRNVSRLKKIQPRNQSGGRLSSQADASHSRRKHHTGSQKYTRQVIMLVTYGALLTTYLAKLNLELNISFLRRITTPTSTRKSLLSGLRRRLRHRRSTLEVTNLDWTASRPWAFKMLKRRSELRSANSVRSTLYWPGSWRKPLHPRTLNCKNFQIVDYWGTFSANMEARYCYAAIEESCAGRVFSIKLSSGFKSSIPFESPRKDCQPSTYRLSQRVSLVSRCSVGIQTMSLNGNRSIESIFR